MQARFSVELKGCLVCLDLCLINSLIPLNFCCLEMGLEGILNHLELATCSHDCGKPCNGLTQRSAGKKQLFLGKEL